MFTHPAQPASATAKTAAHPWPSGKIGLRELHMPKVNLPGGYVAFTDHEIRVARPGEPYPD
jgi:hypothetical protein